MIIGLFIICATVLIKFKPMYSIKLGNKKIGYLENLQSFDNYIEEIKENDNIAFVELKEQPEFKLKLVNRNTNNSEDKIKEKIHDSLLIEYTSYAITYKGQNVVYLSNMEIAEKVINQVKEENNSNELGILQIYSDNYDEIMAEETDEAVTKISKEIKKQNKSKNKNKLASRNNVKAKSENTKSTNKKVKKNVKTEKKIEETSDKDKKEKSVSKAEKEHIKKDSSNKQETNKIEKTKNNKLTIALSKPLSGIITSRFGGRRSPGGIGSTNHKGLDIAAKRGTTIKAAAAGTVKFAGYKGSLGNLVIIDHGNGMQTYYGHSSKIYVKKGQKVEAGEKIAAVGCTGAATGPHLHFEIHIKGKVVNPQNYVY